MPLSTDSPLLLLDDVHLTLGSAAGDVNILRGVDLRIHAGETVSVVGPSGAGKSTLMMIMAGLERPSRGQVNLGGVELGGLDEDALALLRRDQVGIVFQAFRLIPTMNALENVALPLELGGNDHAFDAAAEALKSVGLESRMEHYPDQLSGGEQQRVALARAFAVKPAVLLADEPTGNLDRETGELVIDLLFEMNTTADSALILITHDPALAARCQRTIHMRDGKLVQEEGASLSTVAGP